MKTDVYHGTNTTMTVVKPGSWVTKSEEVAQEFAQQKTDAEGGVAHVYFLSIDENQVDWDIISQACDIEDERGTLAENVVPIGVRLIFKIQKAK